MVKRLSIIVLALLLSSLAACGPGSSGPETIKIGFFSPLSGASASDGTSARNGAQLAIEKANADNVMPGRVFQLVAYDDRLDSTETVNVARRLIDQDKVQAVVAGSYSGPSRSAAPVFQQAGIPMVTAYAVHPEITKAGDMIFRMIYTGPTQGRAMALFAMEQLGYRKFHLLHIDNDYGNSITEGFTELVSSSGGELVSSASYTAQHTDFSAQLTPLKDQPADALVLVGYYAQSAQIIQQARELGIALPMLGSDGMDSPKLVELAGAHAEGLVLATDFSRNDPRPVVQDFIQRFRKAYNTDPDIVAASSYDATMVLIDAMKRAESSQPQAVRDTLAGIRGFEGVTGIISFTPEREVKKTVLFVKIERGSFNFLGKLDPEGIQ